MHKSKHKEEDASLMMTDDESNDIVRMTAFRGNRDLGRDVPVSVPNTNRDFGRDLNSVQYSTKDLNRTPVGPVEMTPLIDNTKIGNKDDVDRSYNTYDNVREIEPVWYVQMKMVIPILVILAIVVLLAWWWYDTYLLRKKKEAPSPDFSAMLQTFYSYSDDFWFSKDVTVFKETLSDSKYHFIIADSNMQVLYDNRNSYTWLYPNYEIIKSISDDKPSLVSLNGVRTLASTVHKGSAVRIVHMEYIG